MSENEFQKRLKTFWQAFPILEREYSTNPRCKLIVKDFFIFLAEAKADFPTHNIQRSKTSGEYIAMLPGEVEEIDDWYQKWFGEGTTQK